MSAASKPSNVFAALDARLAALEKRGDEKKAALKEESALSLVLKMPLARPPPMVEMEEKLNDINANFPGDIVVDESGKLIKKYITYAKFSDFLQKAYDDWITNRLDKQITVYQIDLPNGNRVVFDKVRKLRPTYTTGVSGKEVVANLLPHWARISKMSYELSIRASVFLEKPIYVDSPEAKTMTSEEANRASVRKIVIRPKLSTSSTGENKAEKSRDRAIVGWRRETTDERIVNLGRIPLMTGSENCYLHDYINKPQIAGLGECPQDPFGYFIIGGVEKVIIIQEKLRLDKVFVFINHKTKELESRITIDSDRGTKLIVLTMTKPDKENSSTGNQFQIFIPPFGSDEKQSSKKNRMGVFQLFQLLEEIYDPHGSHRFRGEQGVENMKAAVSMFLKPEDRQVALLYLIPSLAVSGWNQQGDVVEIAANYMKLNDRSREEKIKEIKVRLEDSINPNNLPYMQVIYTLIMMLVPMVLHSADRRELDDRDSWSSKRLDTAGPMLESLYRVLLKGLFEDVAKTITTNYELKNIVNLIEGKQQRAINDEINASFVTSNWGKKGTKTKPNVVQTLRRTESIISVLSHLHTIDVDTNKNDKNPSLRLVQPSQLGFIDPVTSTENDKCGITKAMAVTATVTVGKGDASLVQSLRAHLSDTEMPDVKLGRTNPCIVNGKFRGWCNGSDLAALCIANRRHNSDAKQYFMVDHETSIIFNRTDNILYISTSRGIIMRPILVVNKNNELEIDVKKDDAGQSLRYKDIGYLLRAGVMDYIEPWEQEYSNWSPSVNNLRERREVLRVATQSYTEARQEMIKAGLLDERTDTIKGVKPAAVGNLFAPLRVKGGVMQLRNNLIRDTYETSTLNKEQQALLEKYRGAKKWVDDTMKRRPYDICDLDPQSILGESASIAPIVHTNPAARNTYQASMGKQAIGIYTSNHKMRVGDGMVKMLCYPTRPIFETQLADVLGINDLPQGQQVILAFSTGKYLQEDAIVLNKRSVQLGLFSLYKTIEVSVTVKENTERLGIPTLKTGEDASAYHAIGENGLPEYGAYLSMGDVAIAKYSIIKDARGASKQNNQSVRLGISEEGVVEKIWVVKQSELTHITVRIRSLRTPIVGDKFAPRYAQKGVLVRLVDPEDMPFVESGPSKGMIPDMLVSPLAINTRMTMSYIFEILASKAGLLKYERINASSFRPFKEEEFESTLLQYGYDRHGLETMRDGVTGALYPGKIYMGPCYVQALRHHVKDKIQVRSRGATSMLHGQAVKGRKNVGGVRFGEMERDALISHGATGLMQERFSTQSDVKQYEFCRNCKTKVLASLSNGKWLCKKCGAQSNVGKVSMPQTFDFLSNVLAGMAFDLSLDMITTKESKERENRRVSQRCGRGPLKVEVVKAVDTDAPDSDESEDEADKEEDNAVAPEEEDRGHNYERDTGDDDGES